MTPPPTTRSSSDASGRRSTAGSGRSTGASGRVELTPTELVRNNIETALNVLSNDRHRLKKNKDLSEAIKEYPDDLQDVARLLATMPVTQVSVERLFSALKLLKSDLRNKLKDDIIGDILLLRANL